MPAILFVCTGNRCRSLVAAAAFCRLLEKTGCAGQWTVSSAGTWGKADLPPVPAAIEAAKQRGLDISASRSRVVDAQELAKSDLVVVMESGQQEALVNEFPWVRQRVYLLAEIATGIPYDIPDPLRAEEEVEMSVREICDLVEKGFAPISQLARNNAQSS